MFLIKLTRQLILNNWIFADYQSAGAKKARNPTTTLCLLCLYIQIQFTNSYIKIIKSLYEN